MKQKLLSALIATACATLATSASAGVIQASYKNFAAEIFGADVAMTVPVIGYSLAQPLTGSAANPNQFEITWTLTAGEWDAANLPTATLVSTQLGGGGAPVGIAGTVTKVSATVLKAAFVLNQGTSYPINSQIVLGEVNAEDAGGIAIVTANGKIGKVNTILRTPADAACAPTTAQVGVTVKMTNAAGVEFESNFQNYSNSTPILQSGVALRASAVSSSAYTTTKETSQVNVLTPALGKFFTDTGDVTLASTTAINLGQVRVANLNTLFDLNGDVPHSVTNAAWNASLPADGGVSQNGLSVRVDGRFATTGTLFLSVDANCTSTLNGVAGTFNTGRTQGTVTLTKLEYNTVAAVGGVRAVNVCYSVPGGNTAVIPTSSFQIAAGTSAIAKVGTSNEIDTPVCAGALYDLSANGVRVDVRNYIPDVARVPSTGWYSIIRVINTDESQPSVDVIGTALLRDGHLGATGVIAAGMKPREVRYLTSAQIDTVLNAAATSTARTFGADDIGQNARLRITAPSASIRVQNYHFNPSNGNFFEASSAQGDDGVVNGNAPTIADVIRARADGQNK